ncbi:hypothetical protein [Streptomyces sp. SPB162]|uniref:hypothetical protein n=1 Tax=Streptomyces sp. SPB162 TaxID=2940560 RepID=UPI002407345A|nr:hypothetical protein [Streptomyces sp. SPB162]MDF9812405.1 hypothetical protein [Streptomyces sp. SPB162]
MSEPPSGEVPAGAIAPLGLTPAPTGQTAVDSLMVRLSDADDLPTADHLEVYEDVHRGLRDALTALDDNRS